MAKAPVPGEVKTRLGADVGDLAAADLAAAALLDTLALVRAAFPDRAGVVALAGDTSRARRREELGAALASYDVVPQRGGSFAERLACAHAEVGGPTLQIGMDTPHLAPADLTAVADALPAADAVLGDAEDGGWWVLALRDPEHARVLLGVPMSQADTGSRTRAALADRGLRVATAAVTYDVDTVAEAERAAAAAPDSAFARTWDALGARR